MKTNNPQKIFLESAEIHCKSNAILGSKLLHYFEENKLVATNNIKEADFVLINTCGFDKRHENISENIIKELTKKSSKDTKIITVGCLNKTNRKLLQERFPDIHIVNEGKELDDILNAKESLENIKREFLDPLAFKFITNRRDNIALFSKLGLALANFLLKVSKKFKYPFAERIKLEQIINEIFHHNKFYVQIGRGCLGKCSYCVIKKAQGMPKSRSIADIINDIKTGLISKHSDAESMVINLVADDCASFGFDTNSDLLALLEEINNYYPKNLIDICYLSPEWIELNKSSFLAIFERFPINSVNISVQSGSAEILKLMNRQYSVSSMATAIKQIKQLSPQTMIWSHFMVGFPTESWGDFLSTIKIAKDFHYYAIFKYSSHEGTKSSELSDNVKPIVSFLRAKILFWYLALKGMRKLFFYF